MSATGTTDVVTFEADAVPLLFVGFGSAVLFVAEAMFVRMRLLAMVFVIVTVTV